MFDRIKQVDQSLGRLFDLYVSWTTVIKGGTEELDYCIGVAMADDGSVIVTGYTFGEWGEVNAEPTDFVAVKLNAAGEQVWVWQVISQT